MSKTFLFFLTLGVIAAGIYFGKQSYETHRLEREAVRAASPRDGSSDPAESSATGQAEQLTSPGAEGDPDSSRDAARVKTGAGLPSRADIAGVLAELEAARSSAPFREIASSAEARVEALVSEYARGTGTASPELLERLAPLLRFQQRMIVFAAVTLQLEREQLPETIYAVELENGNRLHASSAALVADSYEIRVLPSGDVTLPASSVREVRKFARAAYLAATWKELDTKLAGISNPVDLYVRGVSRCYRLGLEEEAYVLLERLLGMPDSHQVPAIFAIDAGPEIALRWEQAAGRSSVRLPGVTVIASGTGGDGAGVGRAGSRSEGSAGSATEAPGVASSRVTSSTITSPGSDEISEILKNVRSLETEAQVIYQRVVVGRAGELDELHGAREKLERAVDMLGRLPPADPEVRGRKREVAQLLHAVIKSLPF